MNNLTLTTPERKYYAICEGFNNTDRFIHHAANYPLAYRQIYFKHQNDATCNDDQGCIGLCFETNEYIKTGTTLEISFTVHGELQKFHGTVTSAEIRENEKYEIQLWLSSKAESASLRIVEQVCYIEVYLQYQQSRQETPINRERITAEWISCYAADFPSV